MPELLADVGDRCAGLQQERRVGVPQVMDTDVAQPCFSTRLSTCRTLRSSRGVPLSDGNTHLGHGLPLLQPSGPLNPAPCQQRFRELGVMSTRRR